MCKCPSAQGAPEGSAASADHEKIDVDDDARESSDSSGSSEFRRLQTAVARVPAEAGGIALNCAGLGSWLSALCELYPALLPVARPAEAAVVAVAAAVLCAFCAQALLNNAHLRGDLRTPKQCGSLGAGLMALTLCCSYTGSRAAVLAASAVQVAMVVWYLSWAAWIRSPPVPFWFPPTVGVGMAGIAGAKVGMDRGLQRAFLYGSGLLCAIEWPWITARLTASDRVAPGPAVMVHAAPVSLVSLCFMQVVVDPQRPGDDDGGGGGGGLSRATRVAAHAFFAGTTAAALLTCYFGYRRRALLREFVLSRAEGFVHQEWAALTFPLLATSAYAVLYAARVPSSAACAYWATALALVTLVVVGAINVLYLGVGMPRWIDVGLPGVPEWPPLPPSATNAPVR